MTYKIPIQITESINTDSLLSQAHKTQNITHDWYKKELQKNVMFNLSVSNDYLLFYAKSDFKPIYDPKLQKSAFVPGLWENDVAEFFLKEDGSEKYQEFNLAPTGAWWSGFFSSYRVEDETNFKRPSFVKIETAVTEKGWEGALLLKREELLVNINFIDSSRANVCFITGDSENRIFISAGHLSNDKPDFHLAQSYPFIQKTL